MDKLSIFLIYHTHQQRSPSRRELSSTSLTALSSLAENLVFNRDYMYGDILTCRSFDR